MSTKTVRKNKWFLAYKRIEEGATYNCDNMIVIEPPEGFYYADPFLFEHECKHWVFFELYDYDKGVIACAELTDDGLGPVQVVLDQPTHLSFPFVFEENGKIYMIPESGQSGILGLWECTEFPGKWEFRNMLWDDGNCADPVLVKRGNTYFIYTSINSDHVQVVLRSDSLFKRFELACFEERMNSRSAGRVWKHEPTDGFVRPVQNCEGGYGEGVILKWYCEDHPYDGVEIRRLPMDWYPGLTGFHTFNFDSKYLIVDGKIPYDQKMDTNR